MSVRYRLQCAADAIDARARALAVEQSIEMPIDAVRDERVRAEVVGEVVSIEPSSQFGDRFDVVLALAVETTGEEPGQLLNMVFGNCSLQPDVELIDLELPVPALAKLPGPRFGIAGWRAAIRSGDATSAAEDAARRNLDAAATRQSTAAATAEQSTDATTARQSTDATTARQGTDATTARQGTAAATAKQSTPAAPAQHRTPAATAQRPLSCTALKPQGLDAHALAALAYVLARAGIDVVKDDHGIADQACAPFAQRVPLVQRAIERANREKRDACGRLAGHRTVYAPTISGGPRRLAAQLAIAHAEGVGALLCCPMIIGVPAFAEFVRAEAGVPLLAHPALAGHVRIAAPLLLGRLFRLFGADATIFPSWGGRFSHARAECLAIADRAREPLDGHRPTLPVPAGGMRVERIEQIVRAYGADTMLLIGGDLLRAGDALPEHACRFAQRVAEAMLHESDPHDTGVDADG